MIRRYRLAAFLFTAAAGGSASAQAADDRLPVYQKPAGPNKGVLRVFGAGLHGLLKDWETGYMKHNPDVRIADNPGGSDAAIGVLQHGTAAIIKFLGYDPRPKPTTIGERLIAFRLGKGWARPRLAAELRVDPSTLARWETGKRNPRDACAVRVQELLG